MDGSSSPLLRSRHHSNSGSTADGGSGAAVDDDFNALLVTFYTRAYPSANAFADDAADLEVAEINDAVAELATEVAALREETEVLGAHVQTLQQRRPGGGSGVDGSAVGDAALDGFNVGGGGVAATAASTQNEASVTAATLIGNDSSMVTMNPHAATSAASLGPHRGGSPGSRRGRSYRRRSLGALDLFMRVDDKATLLRQETVRLRSQEERITKEADGVQEVLVATVEEALRRQQELQLEVLQFDREVVGDVERVDGDASAAVSAHRRTLEEAKEVPISVAAASTTADELLRYLERRHTTQVNYLDKLEVQCQAVEQDIARAQQLVRQRRIAGEAFQAVDLEQLRIEHKQFAERMAAKNNELAELKGTSTRTVQQLNQLMGQLNELASEQTRLKRESKNRSEYLSRCDKEYATASAEAVQAESKHDALKAQQEAIKAPKIEEYMAQKAEEVELEKAVKNWERKVQIAEGQATVVRQHVRRMQTQRTAAVRYASEKRQHHVQQQQHLLQQQQQQQQQQRGGNMTASSKPLVGGARSLLQQRRQQQHQQQQHQEDGLMLAAEDAQPQREEELHVPVAAAASAPAADASPVAAEPTEA